MDDLKWMGEGNAVVNRRKGLHPETVIAAAEIYRGELLSCLSFALLDADTLVSSDLHGLEDGTIPATFQIMHMVTLSLFALFPVFH